MTCRVGFRDADLQRDHYKSDWHRYNLKRKIVSLPPVTADNFAERVAIQEAQQAEANKDTSQYCSVCKKSFGNDKAFQTHILSKKHLLMIKELSKKDAPENQELLNRDLKNKCSISSEGGVVLGSSPGKSQQSPFAGKKTLVK
jgi:pre-60S factor REI1